MPMGRLKKRRLGIGVFTLTNGYRNVYELGPLLDIKKTKLDFAGSLAVKKVAEARTETDREGGSWNCRQLVKVAATQN